MSKTLLYQHLQLKRNFGWYICCPHYELNYQYYQKIFWYWKNISIMSFFYDGFSFWWQSSLLKDCLLAFQLVLLVKNLSWAKTIIIKSLFNISIINIAVEERYHIITSKLVRGPESMFSNLLQIFTICLLLWEKYLLKITASYLNSLSVCLCLKF